MIMTESDYQKYKKLYLREGGDEVLKVLLRLPFMTEPAVEGLQVWAAARQAEQDKSARKADYSQAADNEPDELLLIRESIKKMYLEAVNLRTSLAKTEPAGRYDKISRILGLFRKINEQWGAIRYWREYHVLPPDLEPETESDPLRLYRKYLNLVSRISKKKYENQKDLLILKKIQIQEILRAEGYGDVI